MKFLSIPQQKTLVIRPWLQAIKRVFASLLFCTLCAGVSTSWASGTTLNLDQALQKALDLNPALKIYRFKNQSLEAQLETASLKPAYQLGLELDRFAGTGQSSGFDNLEALVSISSRFELGQKVDARQQLVRNVQADLALQKQWQALDLIGQVTRRYIEVLRAQEHFKLAQERLELAQSAHQTLSKRVATGAVSSLEARRAKADQIQAELELAQHKTNLKIAQMALAETWGEQSLSFERVSGNLYELGRDPAFEVFFEKLENNPEIQLFASQERLKQSELRLAQAESNLDIDWSLGIRQSQMSGDSDLRMQLSVPLYSVKRNQGRVQAIEAEQHSIPLKKQQTWLRFHRQLYQTYQNRQQAILTAERLRTQLIPELQTVMSEMEAAYLGGRYSYLDYITSRQELLNAKRHLIEASSGALTYGVEIEQLTAEPLLDGSDRIKNL